MQTKKRQIHNILLSKPEKNLDQMLRIDGIVQHSHGNDNFVLYSTDSYLME